MTRAEHLGRFRSLQQSFLVLDHLVDRTNLPNQPVDVLKKRIQGGKPQNSTKDHQEIVKQYQQVVRAYNNFMREYPWMTEGLMQDNCWFGDMLKDEMRKKSV